MKIYLNRQSWELVPLPEAEPAPANHIPLPIPAVLLLGPVLGLAFILFVPILVPLLAIYALAKVISSRIPRLSSRTHALAH